MGTGENEGQEKEDGGLGTLCLLPDSSSRVKSG
jgi:hypothetical protein